MNLADRMCPRERMLGTALPKSDFAQVLSLLETLMTPTGVDAFGNYRCWIHEAAGMEMLILSISPDARQFWIPILVRSSSLWNAERAAAQKTADNVH